MRFASHASILMAILLAGCSVGTSRPLSARKQAEFNALVSGLGKVDAIRPGGRVAGRIVGYEMVACPALIKLIRLDREAARKTFRESLDASGILVRLSGAVGLAKIRDPAGAPVLRQIASDGEAGEAVRATALFTLARLKRDGDDRFFQSLLTTVHDPPLTVNVVAAAIDGWSAWPDRVDRAVMRDRLNDEDEALRIAVYTTLTRFAVDALFATRDKLTTKDRPATLRQAAARLPRDELAEQAIADAAGEKRSLRLAAVRYAASCNDPKALDILRTAAVDGEIDVRLAAADGLALFGAPEDARLIEPLVDSPSLKIALAAIRKLRLINEPNTLADCLADEKRWQVRAAALKALAALDPARILTVWPKIAPLAADRSIVVRIAVAEAADRAADPRVAGAICTLLGSNSTVVRRKAIAVANRVTGLKLHLPASATRRERAKIVDAVRAWLREHHPSLAAAPTFTAPRPLDDRRKKTLVRLLDEVRTKTGSVSPATLENLRKLGPAAVHAIESEPRGTAFWARLAGDVLPAISDAYLQLSTIRNGRVAARRQAALALVVHQHKTGISTRVREEIVARLRVVDDYFVFRYLLRAADASTPAKTAGDGDPLDEALLVCLKQRDSRIRAEAADALGRRKSVKALDPLLRLLEDDRSGVVVAAASALGHVGERRAVAALLLLLTHRSPHVRLTSAIALERLGSVRGRIELIGHLHGRSRPLAVEAIGFLRQARCQWAVGHLVTLLADEDAAIVHETVEALRSLAGKNFGYTRFGPAARRHQAIARWNTWWAEQAKIHPTPVSHTPPLSPR